MQKPGNVATEQNVTVVTMTGGEVEIHVTDSGKGRTFTLANDEAKALMVALAKLS